MGCCKTLANLLMLSKLAKKNHPWQSKVPGKNIRIPSGIQPISTCFLHPSTLLQDAWLWVDYTPRRGWTKVWVEATFTKSTSGRSGGFFLLGGIGSIFRGVLLMEEILHQLIGSLSHYLQDSFHQQYDCTWTFDACVWMCFRNEFH